MVIIYEAEISPRPTFNHPVTPLLPIIGKLFEKNISKQLINYINDNYLVGVYQSAYNKGHNTETSLLATINI